MPTVKQMLLAGAGDEEETLEIMGNAALLADIKEAIVEAGKSPAIRLTKDEALQIIAES